MVNYKSEQLAELRQQWEGDRTIKTAIQRPSYAQLLVVVLSNGWRG